MTSAATLDTTKGAHEGNYWSDYQEADCNNDGTGDVPYSIGDPGRSADIYPVVTPDGRHERQSTTIGAPKPEIPEPSPGLNRELQPLRSVALPATPVGLVTPR